MGSDDSSPRPVTLSGLSFNEGHKIVIRGVLYEWEKGTSSGCSGSPARLIVEALRQICKEDWNIVMYDDYLEERGYGTFYHYDNKWWVYGRSTSCCDFDKQAIINLMDHKFGWAKIADIEKFQAAAESELYSGLPGKFRIHVVKLPAGASWDGCIYGTYWYHDDYSCAIMREW
jgi:hypothetical protein